MGGIRLFLREAEFEFKYRMAFIRLWNPYMAKTKTIRRYKAPNK
jgi:hypothetical protein